MKMSVTKMIALGAFMGLVVRTIEIAADYAAGGGLYEDDLIPFGEAIATPMMVGGLVGFIIVTVINALRGMSTRR